jgi:ABC-type enterochelin transport system permease subunit
MTRIKESRRLLAYCLLARFGRWLATAIAIVTSLSVLSLLVIETKYHVVNSVSHAPLVFVSVLAGVEAVFAWALLLLEKRLLKQYRNGQ